MHPMGEEPGGTTLAGVRAALRRAREGLEQAERDLSALERSGGASTGGARPRPARYFEVLVAVYERGRHGSDLATFGRIGAEHGYTRRGLGGFFVGARAPLRMNGERVWLTPEGRRLVDEYLREEP